MWKFTFFWVMVNKKFTTTKNKIIWKKVKKKKRSVNDTAHIDWFGGTQRRLLCHINPLSVAVSEMIRKFKLIIRYLVHFHILNSIRYIKFDVYRQAINLILRWVWSFIYIRLKLPVIFDTAKGLTFFCNFFWMMINL